MSEETWQLVLSCEHGGNRVPEAYLDLFRGREDVLNSHRGWDIGIAPLAQRLSANLKAPLQLAEVTRLLVELNRSPGHPALFSEFSRQLNQEERALLLRKYYYSYRDAVVGDVAAGLDGGGRVCHLSVHSFTPELKGEIRRADIGLLYDPGRPAEKNFCRTWQQHLRSRDGRWRIRCNYPYRGAADSLVTFLRRRFAPADYLGLELEINQRWPLSGGPAWTQLQELICATLGETLAGWRQDGGKRMADTSD